MTLIIHWICIHYWYFKHPSTPNKNTLFSMLSLPLPTLTNKIVEISPYRDDGPNILKAPTQIFPPIKMFIKILEWTNFKPWLHMATYKTTCPPKNPYTFIQKVFQQRSSEGKNLTHWCIKFWQPCYAIKITF